MAKKQNGEVAQTKTTSHPKTQSKPQQLTKTPAPQAEVKRIKTKKILKKIEDFNKFTRLRTVKEARKKKEISEMIQLDTARTLKAVKALQKFREAQKANSKLLLEDDDEFIYIELTLSKLPEEYSLRPYFIKLPTPIYSEDYFSKFCLFVKDPQDSFEEKIQDMNLTCLGKVIGYTQLVKEYNNFEEKRKLCKEFDLFFCDYKIYDLMRRPLGKPFYDRKKIPFPIDCENVPGYSTAESYEQYLNSLGEGTYFVQGHGPNYTLKVARLSMDVKTASKNVLSSVQNLIAHILEAGKLAPDTVRRISLKTATSPSLPLYSYLSEQERNLLPDAIQLLQE